MAYETHWSAIRSRQSTNTHPAPPSPYLARIRSEATRRGLYAAGPVTQPPPPAPAVPIGKDAARPPTSLNTSRLVSGTWFPKLSFCSLSDSIPPTPQAAEARWANDAALRAEFRESKARYLAWCRAIATGRVKIAAGRVVTGSNP